jgi:hypothetical protein
LKDILDVCSTRRGVSKNIGGARAQSGAKSKGLLVFFFEQKKIAKRF